ncbi:MAG TPA: RluA family pseudouridine synthase [Ruminococcaceae bacterium]|nr:RluA family pseudouridine synthase [Oscillospiraceae bacterium]
MPEKLTFTVPDECDGMTAKWFLKSRCGLSTRMITQLKREKDGILMDGKILRSIDPVRAKAEITVTLPSEQMSILPVEGSLDVAFEDSHILVVNKPPFMPVHPVKQHQTDTLANIAAFYSRQRGEDYVFRALNRLDRDTSGLVLIAKDRFTVNKLKNAVYKEYFAVVHGIVQNGGTINAPIGVTPESKIVRHVLSGGTPAVTHYSVESTGKDCTLLRLWLETGRTHQIRCHMSSIGYPLLGDELYGGSREKINRQALHCGLMSFSHPVTGKKISISARMPQDMQKLIK